MLDVIGVPFDLCGRHLGSRLGPISLRLAGLVPGLGQIVGEENVRDLGDVVAVDERAEVERGEAGKLLCETLVSLKARVAESCHHGRVPVVLGGDHSLTIGSLSAALEVYGDKLGVLWIDAHADCNSPATSPSGNIHGMPLAALTGTDAPCREDVAWREELDLLWPRLLELSAKSPLDPNHAAWIGLRDVDPGEARFIARASRSFVATMQTVDTLGLGPTLDSFWEWAANSGLEKIWVSFDVDSLDPIFAPGTGTAVRGGFSYREGHLIAETLHEGFVSHAGPSLAGLDVVEVNPLRDHANTTAGIAFEWVRSFFGETILHDREGAR
ncbi:MAG: arginase [Fimbriimonadaceae bacterium]|nr:arginase [Fimbriimonadaceae bacterium]